MNDIMVDIETLSTKVNAVILSISAVEFDIETGELGKEFEAHIDINSCLKKGREIDGETLMWWMGQSEEARSRAFSKNRVRYSLDEAVLSFFNWLHKLNGRTIGTKVWGNSNRFDLGILAFGFDEFVTWSHWNERDVRTLSSLAPQYKLDEPFTGVKHYGIDDCKHQIKYVTKTWKHLK